jgi:hypothetical protein
MAAQSRPVNPSILAATVPALEEMVQPRPRRKARRRVKRAAAIVWTVVAVWLLGFGGAVIGSVMIGTGYEVDAMQAHLTTLTRQEQDLAGQVAVATSPAALAAAAHRLHVTLAPVVVAGAAVRPHPAAPAQVSAPSRWGTVWGRLVDQFRQWLSRLHRVESRPVSRGG